MIEITAFAVVFGAVCLVWAAVVDFGYYVGFHFSYFSFFMCVFFRMFLQETYEVQDLNYYDDCTSDKGYWVKSDATKINYSFSNGVMLIQGLGASSDSFLNLNINYPSNYQFEITIAETLSYYSCGIRCDNVGLEADSSRKYLQTYSPYSYTGESGKLYEDDVIKFVVENGTVTMYLNDVQKRQSSTTNDGFRFSTYQSRQLKIKEIKVKAL